MNNTFITRKNVLILSLLLILVWGIVFLFTHSLLTVSGVGDDNKSITISKDGVEHSNFNLRNDKKTLLLSRGSYRIDVDAEKGASSYRKGLGGLSKHNLEVEVMPQKAITQLGVSKFDCSIKQIGGSPAGFYPCDNYRGVSEIKNGGEVVSVFDTLIARLGGQDSHQSALSYSQKSSGQGFLLAVSKSGTLFISNKPSLGQNSESPTEVKDFDSRITDSTFSTVVDGSSQNFAVLDTQNNSLLLFDDSSQDNPRKVDLSAELKDYDEDYTKSVFVSKEVAFVVVARGAGELEGDHQHTDAEEEESESMPGKVIVVDSKKGSITKTHKLPKGYVLLNASSSSAGTLLMLPLYHPEAPILTQEKDRQEKLELPWEDIKEICWKDGDSFYYSRTTDSQIYLHSLDKQASFLVYSNPFSSVENLNCSFGALSFTLSSEDDGVVDEFVHYVLSDKDILRGRVEWALPILLAAGGDSIRVTQEGSSLVVNPIFAGPQNERLGNDKIKELVVEKFKDQGIDPGDIEININY